MILTIRAPSGVPFALEVRALTRWDDALLKSPAIEVADVRAVTLAIPDGVPSRLPGWLAVISDGAPPAWDRVAQALWPASPHYRERGTGEAEFRAAGVAALRHAAGQGAFGDPIDAVCAGPDGTPMQDAARERWLHVRFGTPERFATFLLIQQIAGREPGTAAMLRFLDAAEVPESGAWAELAFDRRVLLEQATPWRYFEGAFAPALAALTAWRRRYETAYARHYATAREDLTRARGGVGRVRARAMTADRLASILACEGSALAPRVAHVAEAIESLPASPRPDTPITADVQLGLPHPAHAALEALRGEIDEALDTRLRRLSTALAHRVLDGPGDELGRVLAAIQAGDVSDLDRVLDGRLAARLTRVLHRERAADPLAEVAARFPEVREDDVDTAVTAFRNALTTAVCGAPDGVARLVR